MADYIKSKEHILNIEKQPLTRNEITNQLSVIESLQKDLESHHNDFEELVIASSKRLGSSFDNMEVLQTVNYVTDKWHELTRFASEQYQLLTLTQHYKQSSEEIVDYLEMLEQKLEGDVPISVQKKNLKMET